MQSLILVGAEQVASAGNNIKQAAEQMSNVSGNVQVVLEAHQRFLDDWLLRFEQMLDQRAERGVK
jgi:hypothetical protein